MLRRPHVPAALLTEEQSRNTLNLDGRQSQSGCVEKEKPFDLVSNGTPMLWQSYT
jgi:hypothetical protein